MGKLFRVFLLEKYTQNCSLNTDLYRSFPICHYMLNRRFGHFLWRQVEKGFQGKFFGRHHIAGIGIQHHHINKQRGDERYDRNIEKLSGIKVPELHEHKSDHPVNKQNIP